MNRNFEQELQSKISRAYSNLEKNPDILQSETSDESAMYLTIGFNEGYYRALIDVSEMLNPKLKQLNNMDINKMLEEYKPDENRRSNVIPRN